MLASTPNHASSGQIRGCSGATSINNRVVMTLLTYVFILFFSLLLSTIDRIVSFFQFERICVAIADRVFDFNVVIESDIARIISIDSEIL